MKNIMDAPVLTRTDFPGVKILSRGKVRDIYQAGERLVMVATDRISAFDCVLGTGIPRKGEVLTQLSVFWFDHLKDVVRNHFVSADPEAYPQPFPQFREQLAKRSMLVKAVKPAPIECVVRGYLSGSGWKEYKANGTVCGIALPSGLTDSDRLPEPIFTPSTKAMTGHDENISYEETEARVGKELAEKLREASLALYRKAAQHAESRGIILADTKFEFGTDAEGMMLIDEVLTPDSSRFWPAEEYKPGGPQFSFDKQYVRNHLEKIGWNKQPPAPELPPEVVEQTASRYMEIYQRLTGHSL